MLLLASKGEKDQKNATAKGEGREAGTPSAKGKQTGGRAEQNRTSQGWGVIMHDEMEDEH